MKFNTQKNKIWHNDVMTERETPNFEGKIWKDCIWRYGCLITAISNIIQFFTCHTFTPKIMNDLIITIRGYYYLQDPQCPEAIASFLHWPTIKKYFNKNFEIKENIPTSKYVRTNNKRYIARIKHPRTLGGHYVNVLDKNKNWFWLFDVETGEIIIKEDKHIKKMIEFKYLVI